MRPQLLAASIALAFASAAAPLRAANVLFVFQGQITGLEPGLAESSTTFHVGDPFTLALEFTPSGPTPAFGYTLAAGSQAITPDTVHQLIAPYYGLGPPYADTYFADSVGYSMYCNAHATLANNLFNFAMFDEDAGPWGSVTVGTDFPSAWFADPTGPLPNDASILPFAASGQLSFNYLNVGGANLTGTITSGSVSLVSLASLDSGSAPVPEPASLCLVLLAAPALLLRRRA